MGQSSSSGGGGGAVAPAPPPPLPPAPGARGRARGGRGAGRGGSRAGGGGGVGGSGGNAADADEIAHLEQLAARAFAKSYFARIETTDFELTSGINHRNPLTDAVARGDIGEASALLAKRGMDINVRNEAGSTALHVAAAEHGAEMIKFLVSRGAAVNGADDEGRTPLMVAIAARNSEAFLTLIGLNEVSINATDFDGKSAIFHALESGDASYIRALQRRRPNVQVVTRRSRQTLLRVAVTLQDSSYTDTLIKSRFYLLSPPSDYDKALELYEATTFGVDRRQWTLGSRETIESTMWNSSTDPAAILPATYCTAMCFVALWQRRVVALFKLRERRAVEQMSLIYKAYLSYLDKVFPPSVPTTQATAALENECEGEVGGAVTPPRQSSAVVAAVGAAREEYGLPSGSLVKRDVWGGGSSPTQPPASSSAVGTAARQLFTAREAPPTPARTSVAASAPSTPFPPSVEASPGPSTKGKKKILVLRRRPKSRTPTHSVTSTSSMIDEASFASASSVNVAPSSSSAWDDDEKDDDGDDRNENAANGDTDTTCACCGQHQPPAPDDEAISDLDFDGPAPRAGDADCELAGDGTDAAFGSLRDLKSTTFSVSHGFAVIDAQENFRRTVEHAVGGSAFVPSHYFRMSSAPWKRARRDHKAAVAAARQGVLHPSVNVLDVVDAGGVSALGAAAAAVASGQVRHTRNVQMVMYARTFIAVTDDILV